MAKLELNERKQRLLMALVERHIRHGQPVGSKTLATGSGLAVSPATIRNLMAELEDMGLLASPHTSAGRVPTERGYRLYVDTLLASSTMERPDNARLRDELRQMLAPVLDGDEEPQPGATALVKILTLSERAALRDNGPLGQIALEAIPAVLQEEAQSQGGDEVRAATHAREQ